MKDRNPSIAVLDVLSEDDRDVLVRKYVMDQSYAEMAEDLRLSPDGARSRKDRAVRKLRNAAQALDE